MNIGEQKKMFCSDCQEYTMHTLVSEIQEGYIGNNVITGTVIYWKCPECGDGYNVDSSDLDRKYTVANRLFHGLLTGEQIKSVREEKNLTVNEFVQLLRDNGISYNEKEYEDIENNLKVQNEKFERFIRKLGNLPEWQGYKKTTK